MACTSPLEAWQYGLTKNGKPKYIFEKPGDDWDIPPLLISCGKCIDCKLSRAKEWATRIVHEAQTAKISCFITLTYEDENLPENDSVDKREIQLFMKALRNKLELKYGKTQIDKKWCRKTKQYKYKYKPNMPVKFFACGEYGDKKKRPHYHVILMGYDFPDKRYWSTSEKGSIQYRSAELESIWQKGYALIGDVTYESAGYVARYTFKKSSNDKHYELIDYDTGEYKNLKKEFILMSQGIGKEWWNRYKSDTEKDYLNVNYRKNKVPRYYDKLMEKENPELLAQLKERRVEKAIANESDPNVLRQRNEVRKVQTKMLRRSYETGGIK